jgi:hypothetical protein
MAAALVTFSLAGISRSCARPALLILHNGGNILDVTLDSVVLPIEHELEGDDIDQVLRASTPSEQLQERQKKGSV